MRIPIWERTVPYEDSSAETPNYMTTYLLDTDKPLPCIVIFPGGGYCMRSEAEGQPIAEFFNTRGIHAVVVEYRVAPYRHPAPLADAQRAIKLVRYHAKEWGIDTDRVITLGFSAGGHLCASTLVYDEVPFVGHTPDAADALSARPNGGILCYPVISVSPDYGHVGSGQNLLGDRYESDHASFNCSNAVTANTPPCFLWHTSEDDCVPVKNSLIFAERLRENRVPFEMHIFPRGYHGLGDGVGRGYPEVEQWLPLAADWVKRTFA